MTTPVWVANQPHRAKAHTPEERVDDARILQKNYPRQRADNAAYPERDQNAEHHDQPHLWAHHCHYVGIRISADHANDRDPGRDKEGALEHYYVHWRAEEPDIVLQTPLRLGKAASHNGEQRISDYRREQKKGGQDERERLPCSRRPYPCGRACSLLARAHGKPLLPISCRPSVQPIFPGPSRSSPPRT